jgi:hypothetical protein
MAGLVEGMLKSLSIAVAPLLILAGSASAEPHAQKEVGQYVDLEPVGMPIIVKGDLLNYVFVYVRINLTGRADVSKWRDKEPFFRDALVRDGHRTPFVVPTDYQKVDEARLIAALTRDVVAIAGPDVVRSVVVTSQTPQHRVSPPLGAPAPRP